jgi:hypothetical protein
MSYDVFGLAFDRKSKLTVASSAFVTGMILFCSQLKWIDQEIAWYNLFLRIG